MRTCIATLLATAALTACAVKPITSAYYTPEGTELLYEYGNFCGPGVPALASTEPAGRIAELERLRPVDHVDLACRNHDLCYERLGHDHAPCDLEFSTVLKGDFQENETLWPCYNLSLEIRSAFLVKWRSTGGAESLARKTAYPLEFANAALAEPFAQLSKAQAGFPDRPGTCFFADPNAVFAQGAEARERGRVTVTVNGQEVY